MEEACIAIKAWKVMKVYLYADYLTDDRFCSGLGSVPKY